MIDHCKSLTNLRVMYLNPVGAWGSRLREHIRCTIIVQCDAAWETPWIVECEEVCSSVVLF